VYRAKRWSARLSGKGFFSFSQVVLFSIVLLLLLWFVFSFSLSCRQYVNALVVAVFLKIKLE
jgi:hypothetical protein